MSAKIPFYPVQESGGDQLAGGSPMARNVVFDAKGAVRRRPVISALEDAPDAVIDANGIDALHVTAGGEIIAVGGPAPNAKIYRVGSGNAIDISPALTSQVVGGRVPILAETEALVVIAAGSYVQKIDLSTWISSRLQGDVPRASHVIANRSRLLVNTLTGNLNQVFYSDLAAGSSYAGHEVWFDGTAGDFSADARPGATVALLDNNSEVYCFGDKNLETFAPEATLIYARSLARESGCIAPYSIVRVEESFAWLDHHRQFVLSDGRSTKYLSTPAIQQQLADMDTVGDCRGYRVKLGSVDAFVWLFPTDGRTFVFSGGAWSQWAGAFNTGFTAQSLAVLDGNPIVGTTGGRIGKLVASGSDDLGERIESDITTGFLTQGTSKRKHCKSISVVMRRDTSAAGELHIAYRDNEGPWSSPLVFRIGEGADRTVVVSKRSLGTYRMRQWRATFSGAEDLLLVGVEEDSEILED